MRFLPGFGNRSSNNPTGLATASVLDAGTLAALLFDRLSDFDGAALAAALVRLPFHLGLQVSSFLSPLVRLFRLNILPLSGVI
jgi:hypothetical protein